jgi:hypothetical protein
MSIEPSHILGAIAIGIGATLVMDLWNLFLKRAFSIPSLNYCLLGRWLRHMPEGTLRHASITAASQRPFELVFPFFILQPSFGLGIAAARTPKSTQARLKSLVTHTVFGVGLYVCALGVSYLLRVHA